MLKGLKRSQGFIYPGFQTITNSSRVQLQFGLLSVRTESFPTINRPKRQPFSRCFYLKWLICEAENNQIIKSKWFKRSTTCCVDEVQNWNWKDKLGRSFFGIASCISRYDVRSAFDTGAKNINILFCSFLCLVLVSSFYVLAPVLTLLRYSR